jgi:hypothetical protein
MKYVHLTVAALIVTLCIVAPLGVCGEDTEDVGCGPSCNKGHGHGRCLQCDRGVCDLHRDGYGQCMVGRYGYGKAPICEKAKEGEPCPVHGYGPCPEEKIDLGLGFRQAFAPAEQPYMGMRPLIQPYSTMQPYPGHPMMHQHMYAHPGYPMIARGPGGLRPLPLQSGYGVPGEYAGMVPPPQPRFPKLHSLFVQPPAYMTTAPQPPMPTYTTRGPRDFLNPNPPSIGY